MKTGKNPQGHSSRRGNTGKPATSETPDASLDPSNWQLPSGQALAEFALRAGCVAPMLLGKAPLESPGRQRAKRVREPEVVLEPAPAGKF